MTFLSIRFAARRINISKVLEYSRLLLYLHPSPEEKAAVPLDFPQTTVKNMGQKM